jgi:hypothetical protein
MYGWLDVQPACSIQIADENQTNDVAYRSLQKSWIVIAKVTVIVENPHIRDKS